MAENTLGVAFLHQRSETSLGHKLSGEEMHSRNLLPRGEKTKMDKRYRKPHHQLSVRFPMQSHIWRDILSIKNCKWREKKRNKSRLISKRFLSIEKKKDLSSQRNSRTCPRARGSACEEGGGGQGTAQDTFCPAVGGWAGLQKPALPSCPFAQPTPSRGSPRAAAVPPREQGAAGRGTVRPVSWGWEGVKGCSMRGWGQ